MKDAQKQLARCDASEVKSKDKQTIASRTQERTVADLNGIGVPNGAVLAPAGGGTFFGLTRRAYSTASEF